MKCGKLSYEFDVEGHTKPKCDSNMKDCPLEQQHVTGNCHVPEAQRTEGRQRR